MNSRERYLNSVLGGPIDRFFRFEFGAWATTIRQWEQQGLPPGVNFHEYFQMDGLVRIPINSGFTNSPYQPHFEVKTIEETDSYKLFVDGDGVTKKIVKPASETSMPQFICFPMESRKDWQAMLRRLNPQDAAARIGDVEALRRRCDRADEATMLPICGAFGHPRNLFGDEALSYVLFDDPALVDEILDNWCLLYQELLKKLTAIIRVDALLIWEDMCYKNGPLISPEHFRRFMLPVYQRLIRFARSCGIRCILVDTDGDCLKLIPLFLEAGVDNLHPFEVQAGMDVVAIRRQYGPTFCIQGGLDKRALAYDKAAIKAEVDRVLPAFLEQGRFLPQLDHTIPPNVSLENFLYYLECMRAYEGQ